MWKHAHVYIYSALELRDYIDKFEHLRESYMRITTSCAVKFEANEELREKYGKIRFAMNITNVVSRE